jgi:hypothetical protein
MTLRKRFNAGRRLLINVIEKKGVNTWEEQLRGREESPRPLNLVNGNYFPASRSSPSLSRQDPSQHMSFSHFASRARRPCTNQILLNKGNF